MAVKVERSGWDPAALRRAWEAAVPARLRREAALGEEEIEGLIEGATRSLESDSPETLREVEESAYRLGQRVIGTVGLEPLLHDFRDSLGRCLASYLPEDPVAAGRLLAFLNRVSDGFWRAHSEMLSQAMERQRSQALEQELGMAKRIQQRLLPRSIPDIRGYDIAGRVLPAVEVGGDYWSVKEYSEDGIVTFKLADVTGHGVAAALLVSAVKFISGGFYRGAKTAAQVMERTNHVLTKETPSDIMVSMVYGWLYPLSHDMTIVNAGHDPVFIYRGGRAEWATPAVCAPARPPSSPFEPIPPTGIVLGLMETRYAEVRVHLNPGDLFFACSDGVTDPGGVEPLGVDRVKEIVARHAEEPARDLAERILDAALERYGHPRDDMSLIVLKRTE
jgi:serine phosphatase RsbU (regulator of sigma subunit)